MSPETPPDAAPVAAPIPVFAAAPIVAPDMSVPADWIDYNGHMNVAYYSRAFDISADVMFDETLLIGERYAATHRMGPYVVQQTLHYIGELLEGDRFRVEIRLLDWDSRKLHVYMEMRRVDDGALCAATEQLVVNVDLEARRAAPYPPEAMARIEALGRAQAALARPERAGASVGIRRKG